MKKTFEILLLELYNELQEVNQDKLPKIKFFLQTILIKNLYPAGYYKTPYYDKQTEDKIIHTIITTPKFFILDTRKFSNFRKIKPLVQQSLKPLYDYKGITLIIEVLAPREISLSNKEFLKYIYEKYTFKQHIVKEKENAYIFAPYKITVNKNNYLIFKNLSFSKNQLIYIYNPFNPFFKKTIIVKPTHTNTRFFLALTLGIINEKTYLNHYAK